MASASHSMMPRSVQVSAVARSIVRRSTPSGSTHGLRTLIPTTNPEADDFAPGKADAVLMPFTDYAINFALILLVLVQVRDRCMDLRSLVLPVVAVAAAAAYYLKGIPTAGNDVVLDLVLGTIGLILGAACALTTTVWRASDGVAHSKAGIAAAVLWVVGVGSRLGFEEFSTHGGSGSIIRFSIAHQITGAEAWVAALVIMALAEVLTRLAVLRVRAAMVSETADITQTLPSRIAASATSRG